MPGVEWVLQSPASNECSVEASEMREENARQPGGRGRRAGMRSVSAASQHDESVSLPDLKRDLKAERKTNFKHEFSRFLELATQSAKGAPVSLKHWRDLAEAWRIGQALRSCAGNRSAAARELGIGRRTLYAKMEKLGIAPRW